MSSPEAESKKPVRLLVMGDSDFASDEYFPLSRFLQIYGNGAQLLLNAIGWTMEDEALTPVRAKTMTSRPIKVDSDRNVVLIKAGNIAGVPVLFCIVGIVVWRLRRSRRIGQKL